MSEKMLKMQMQKTFSEAPQKKYHYKDNDNTIIGQPTIDDEPATTLS